MTDDERDGRIMATYLAIHAMALAIAGTLPKTSARLIELLDDTLLSLEGFQEGAPLGKRLEHTPGSIAETRLRLDTLIGNMRASM